VDNSIFLWKKIVFILFSLHTPLNPHLGRGFTFQAEETYKTGIYGFAEHKSVLFKKNGTDKEKRKRFCTILSTVHTGRSEFYI
jgi:hypothetical protein